jgi:hypothetical protein
MTERRDMSDLEPLDDLPQHPTWEELQREWAEHDAFNRELELAHVRVRARSEALRELAQQQALARRWRLWPF